MGGLAVAVIGYDATEAIENYLDEDADMNDSDFVWTPLAAYKRLLRHLETETSMPLSLVSLEDEPGALTRMFLCFYVDDEIRIYDCAELMAVTVPPQFARVKELLGIEGDVRSVFAPKPTYTLGIAKSGNRLT